MIVLDATKIPIPVDRYVLTYDSALGYWRTGLRIRNEMVAAGLDDDLRDYNDLDVPYDEIGEVRKPDTWRLSDVTHWMEAPPIPGDTPTGAWAAIDEFTDAAIDHLVDDRSAADAAEALIGIARRRKLMATCDRKHPDVEVAYAAYRVGLKCPFCAEQHRIDLEAAQDALNDARYDFDGLDADVRTLLGASRPIPEGLRSDHANAANAVAACIENLRDLGGDVPPAVSPQTPHDRIREIEARYA